MSATASSRDVTLLHPLGSDALERPAYPIRRAPRGRGRLSRAAVGAPLVASLLFGCGGAGSRVEGPEPHRAESSQLVEEAPLDEAPSPSEPGLDVAESASPRSSPAHEPAPARAEDREELDSFEMVERPVVWRRPDPHPRLAGAVVSPGLDAMQAALRERLGGIRQCYETSLGSSRELPGQLVLEMTLQPSGAVDVRVVDDHLGDAELARCIESRLSGMSLSNPSGDRVVYRYPLIFQPAP